MVLDELPYLLRHSPELPSALQRLYDDGRNRPDAPPVRLVVCGSALSVMTELLSGTKALRGRATLGLLLRPFDYRQAAAFWGIGDPETALLVHAVVGGTPGYRDLLASAPRTADEFAEWLAEGVLNPSHALFKEADYLLTEDPRLTDRAVYHSVLTAISGGSTRPAQIGAVVGRDARALTHPLHVLETAGLIHRDDDVLLQRRPSLSVADPIVRFAHLVIRPRLAALEDRRTSQAWAAAQPTFAAGVLGPHFEHLAREWTARFASSETLGGEIGEVSRTVVNDRAGRTQHEVDVVALAAGQRRQAPSPTVRVLGEAKASDRPRTIADLQRLEHIRRLLVGRGVDADGARLHLFGRSGFDEQLRAAQRQRPDVVLVDLDRLYRGD